MTEQEERAQLIEQIERKQLIQQINAKKAAPEPESKPMDYAKDVGAEVLTATGRATEGMADLLNAPINLHQRFKKGFGNLADDDPETGFWGGVSETPQIGEATRQFFKPVTEFADENRSVPEGESQVFDMARTGMKHGLPIAMSGGLGGPAAGGKLVQTLNAMQTPIRNSAVGAGLLSAAGEQIGGEEGETAGALVGGIFGDWRGITDLLKMGKKGVMAASTAVKRKLSGAGVTLDNAGEQELIRAMGRYLDEAYDVNNPGAGPAYLDDLLNKLIAGNAAGKKGTVGQITDNVGLAKFEAKGADDFRELQIRQNQINNEISNESRGAMDAVAPTGDTTLAGDFPKLRVAQEQAALERQAAAADARVQRLEDTTETAFNSRLLNEAAPEGVNITDVGPVGGRQLKTAVTKQYNDAWASTTMPDKATTDAMVDSLEAIIPQIDLTDTAKIKRLQADIVKLSETGTPGALSAIDQRIGKLRHSSANSENVKEILDQMREQFRSGLTETARDALKVADLEYPGFLAVQRAGKSAAGKPTFTAGQAATGARAIGKNKAFTGEAPLQNSITEGTADAGAVETQRQTANALRTKTNAEIKALEASPAAVFGGNEPEQLLKAAESAMKGKGAKKTPIADLKDILKGAPPADKENIRRTFMKSFMNSVSDADGILTQGSLKAFQKNRPIYEKSGMFTPAELQNVEDGLVEAQKLYLGTNSKALAALPPERRRLLEVVSALVGAKVGAAAFGSPLIGASLGRRFAKERLAAFTTEKTEKLAYELSVNPKKFEDILKRLDVDTGEKEAMGILERLMVRAGATGAAESKQQENRGK